MQFRKIEDVENESPNTIIDVVGIVESVQGNMTIQKKDGTETNKRSLLLRDETGRSVELSMWGSHAEHPGVELEEASSLALAPDIHSAMMLPPHTHHQSRCSPCGASTQGTPVSSLKQAPTQLLLSGS